MLLLLLLLYDASWLALAYNVKKSVPYISSKWTMVSILTEFAYEQAGISGCDKSVGNLLYTVSTSVNLSVVCTFEIFYV
jgi:hypothetical protein